MLEQRCSLSTVAGWTFELSVLVTTVVVLVLVVVVVVVVVVVK